MIRPPRFALLLTHLVGDALLLLFAYWWLGTSESDTLHLLLSAASVLVFATGAVWLQAVALACFCGLSYGESAFRAARHLPSLWTLLLCLVAVYALLDQADARFGHSAYVIASYTTMKTRKPVAPTSIAMLFHAAVSLCRWIVIPALAFPLAAALAVHGWSGWRLRFLHRSRSWLYWIEVGLLLAAAIWLPLHLFFWIPALETFAGQMASFLLRTGAGYLLFVGSVLAVEFLTSSGSPCVTQESTAVSP